MSSKFSDGESLSNLSGKFSIKLWFDLKLLKDSGEEEEEFSFCKSLPEALPLP